jgi:RND family efflux transporter MFP subunit
MPLPRGNVATKILLVLAVLGAGAYVAVVGSRSEALVATVQKGRAVDAVAGSVVVHADKDLQELRIEGSGRVVECARLEPGTTVKAGDVLVKLDTTEMERGHADARRRYEADRELLRIRNEKNRDLELARQNLENTRRLHELGNASTESVNAAQRAVDAVLTAQAEADFHARLEAENFARAEEAHALQLKRMTVIAPADGVIEGARVAVGALVSSGATVGTFYAKERIVVAKISEEDIAKVKLGDPARVQLLTFPGREFDAKVIKLFTFADAETRRYDVYLEVKADPSELRPNSTGEVTITVGMHDQVPLVPRRAIFNGAYVYAVRDGRVDRRQVEIGYRGLNSAEVTKGLTVGDQVIVEDLDQFRDGQRVRVARTP